MRKLVLAEESNVEDPSNSLLNEEVEWFADLLEQELGKNDAKELDVAPKLQYMLNQYEPESVGKYFTNIVVFKLLVKKILVEQLASKWQKKFEEPRYLEKAMKSHPKYKTILDLRKMIRNCMDSLSDADAGSEKAYYANLKSMREQLQNLTVGIRNEVVSSAVGFEIKVMFKPPYLALVTCYKYLHLDSSGGSLENWNYFSTEELQELHNKLGLIEYAADIIDKSLDTVVSEQSI